MAECINICKAAMEKRYLKVNIGNMKILVLGNECNSAAILENSQNTFVKSVVVGSSQCELGETH